MSEANHIENYFLGLLSKEEHLLMEAKLLIDKELSEKVIWQQRTYELIKAYSRKKIKREIEMVQDRLFSENKFKNFREKIYTIFKS